MRITFISPPLDMSGGAKVISIYANELTNMGHDVTVVAPARIPYSPKRKLQFFLRGDGWPREPTSYSLPKKIITKAGRPISDDDVPDGDAVIATWWETAEWVHNLSDSKGRKFHLIQHHEVFPPLPPRSKEVYRLPLKKIVIAKWLQDVMTSDYGHDSHLVPNSVDRSQFFAARRDKNTPPIVGLLYSTTKFKGLNRSLEAIRIAQAAARFDVIAFGAETLKKDFRLPKGARYFFRPAQDKIREIYSQCDVWLTMSITEGFNLPALEAMACRTPVISTRAGWPIEGVVDGVNGFLVDDSRAAADRIIDICNMTGAAWQRMSHAAYRTMTTPSWNDSAKMLEAILAESVSDKPSLLNGMKNRAPSNQPGEYSQ